jgi:hypothetical protein
MKEEVLIRCVDLVLDQNYRQGFANYQLTPPNVKDT